MKKHAYWMLYLVDSGCCAAKLILHKDSSSLQKVLTGAALATSMTLAALYAAAAFCGDED